MWTQIHTRYKTTEALYNCNAYFTAPSVGKRWETLYHFQTWILERKEFCICVNLQLCLVLSGRQRFVEGHLFLSAVLSMFILACLLHGCAPQGLVVCFFSLHLLHLICFQCVRAASLFDFMSYVTLALTCTLTGYKSLQKQTLASLKLLLWDMLKSIMMPLLQPASQLWLCALGMSHAGGSSCWPRHSIPLSL